MLIRILQHSETVVDGIDLAQFEVGHAYDVSTALATYLIVEHLAESVTEPEAPDLPLDERREFSGNWRDWAVAADRKKTDNNRS